MSLSKLDNPYALGILGASTIIGVALAYLAIRNGNGQDKQVRDNVVGKKVGKEVHLLKRKHTKVI